MVKVAKVVFVMLAIVLVILEGSNHVEGAGRLLKESVKHPETFNIGGGNGIFPSSPGNFAAGIGYGPDGVRFCTFPGGCTNGNTFPNIPPTFGNGVGAGGGSLPHHP
jgi:hypothetical protein